jgi:hypothetical protein
LTGLSLVMGVWTFARRFEGERGGDMGADVSILGARGGEGVGVGEGGSVRPEETVSAPHEGERDARGVGS